MPKSLILLHKSRKGLPGSAGVVSSWEGASALSLSAVATKCWTGRAQQHSRKKGFISGNNLVEVSSRPKILGSSLSSKFPEAARGFHPLVKPGKFYIFLKSK